MQFLRLRLVPQDAIAMKSSRHFAQSDECGEGLPFDEQWLHVSAKNDVSCVSFGNRLTQKSMDVKVANGEGLPNLGEKRCF